MYPRKSWLTERQMMRQVHIIETTTQLQSYPHEKVSKKWIPKGLGLFTSGGGVYRVVPSFSSHTEREDRCLDPKTS